MSFFPITPRARGPPPPPPTTTAARNAEREGGAGGSRTVDLLGLGERGRGAVVDAGDGGVVVSKGIGEGLVFEGLTLPGVLHEETRAVHTENASVLSSAEVGEGGGGGKTERSGHNI